MNIQIAIRHEAASSDIKPFVEEEIKRLVEKYDILKADVVLDQEGTNGYLKVAEIILKVRGEVITARESSDEMKKSIDLAIKKLDPQLHKYKDTHLKPTNLNRHNGQDVKIP